MNSKESGSLTSGLDHCDLVWIAAVIDCEGAIQLHLDRNSNLSLLIQVNTDDEPIPEHLFQICGGTKHLITASYQNIESRAPHHRWRIYGEKAYALLHEIKPYLLAKKHHAEIVEEIRQQISRQNGLDSDRLSKLLIEYKTLSHKGYKTKNWEIRVRQFIEVTKERRTR